ncbi:MAG: hypothetical protein WDN69_29005 [Aliidongia sp.]
MIENRNETKLIVQIIIDRIGNCVIKIFGKTGRVEVAVATACIVFRDYLLIHCPMPLGAAATTGSISSPVRRSASTIHASISAGTFSGVGR